MEVKLVERQPVTVVYLRYFGAYGEPVARFWQAVFAPWAVINKLGADHVRYGIAHDDPEVMPPEFCRYDACAEVAADFEATQEGQKTTIPGGLYAVYKFRGSLDQLAGAWAALFREWLPASGWRLDSRPAFEVYPPGAACADARAEFECELCLPVVPF